MDNQCQLTVKQSAMLDAIKSIVASQGYPPTYAQISEHMGYKSVTAAVDMTRILERKGYLRIDRGIVRGIMPIERSQPEGGVSEAMSSVDKKMLDMAEGCIDVHDPRAFHRHFSRSSLVRENIKLASRFSGNEELIFLYAHADFIDRQLIGIFEKYEGQSQASDKAFQVLRSISYHLTFPKGLTGAEPCHEGTLPPPRILRGSTGMLPASSLSRQGVNIAQPRQRLFATAIQIQSFINACMELYAGNADEFLVFHALTKQSQRG